MIVPLSLRLTDDSTLLEKILLNGGTVREREREREKERGGGEVGGEVGEGGMIILVREWRDS